MRGNSKLVNNITCGKVTGTTEKGKESVPGVLGWGVGGNLEQGWSGHTPLRNKDCRTSGGRASQAETASA